MSRPLFISALALAALSLPLAGCGGTGRTPGTLEPEGGYVSAAPDTRPLVAEITGVETHATRTGLILRAFGDPGQEGFWDPDLVNVTPTGDDSGTVTFEFRVRPPLAPEPSGTRASRSLDAATFLSVARLRDVERIEIVAANGSRTLRP